MKRTVFLFLIVLVSGSIIFSRCTSARYASQDSLQQQKVAEQMFAVTNVNMLQIEDKLGTVEAGKFADLILLDTNPLNDIRNTRKIAGVFVNGRWLPKNVIDKMLSNLKEKNDANKEKYDWKKFRKQ